MSRVVMPRAYIDRILSSKPVKRVVPFGTIFGSKLALRSRGPGISISPKSPLSFFWPFSVPTVAAAITGWIVLFIAQMCGQLGFHGPLAQSLGELLQPPVFPHNVLPL